MHIFVSLTRQRGKREMEELHPDLLHHFLGGGGRCTCFPEEVQLVALVDPVQKGHPLKINSTSQQVGGSRITSQTCGMKV